MFLRQHRPLLLHYYLTTACQCSCSFCDIHRMPKTRANATDVFQNLAAARKLGAKFVDFTGGEPLLHPNLPEFLNQANKLGFITSVTTNGLLLSDRAEQLKGLIDLPRLSLDGTESIHNTLRGCDSYKTALEGLKKAHEVGLKFDILFTLCRDNQNTLQHVYEVARQSRTVLILDPVFNYFNNDEYRELDGLLAAWQGRPGVYVNRAFLKLRREGGNRVRKPVCKAADAVIVINTDNELVLPCFHKTVDKLLIHGNLLKVWASEAAVKVRDSQGRYDWCEGCTINCYMDPSFCYRLDAYCLLSFYSKARYAYYKYWKQ